MSPISDVRNCDCMELMAEFPDNYFDLAIVDPPYGIGMNGGKSIGLRKKWGKSYAKEKHLQKHWDNNVPEESYFIELFRVSKNAIIWGGNYFNLSPTKGIIAWDKQCDGTDFSHFELAWSNFDRSAKIFRLPIQATSQNRIHPTQKPIELYQWIIKTYAKSGNKILDTHLGSQSSRIAAYKMGFDFWGSELDPDYFRQGCERFEKAIDEPLLRQIQEFKPQTLF